MLGYDLDSAHLHSDGVVYYAFWRSRPDLIKIGTSQNVRSRFNAGDLRPFGEAPRLLVVEPGGTYEEAQRHHEFAHLRQTGEYFEYTDELVEHIGSLRNRYPNYRDLAGAGRDFG
ncbi:hypothetical protein [Kitasatospora mediocidica]|uniref:hypothetical protein n=1 Tax=Kitasatospora mediocidica TaxID=58352 RepID=UPI000A647F14|nr:hypothetical protein [Kitasatospora mediocidica]